MDVDRQFLVPEVEVTRWNPIPATSDKLTPPDSDDDRGSIETDGTLQPAVFVIVLNSYCYKFQPPIESREFNALSVNSLMLYRSSSVRFG